MKIDLLLKGLRQDRCYADLLTKMHLPTWRRWRINKNPLGRKPRFPDKWILVRTSI